MMNAVNELKVMLHQYGYVDASISLDISVQQASLAITAWQQWAQREQLRRVNRLDQRAPLKQRRAA